MISGQYSNYHLYLHCFHFFFQRYDQLQTLTVIGRRSQHLTARAINCGQRQQLIALAADDDHTPCDKQKEATSLPAQAMLWTTVANSRKGQSSLC